MQQRQNECCDIKWIFKFFFFLGVPYPERNISPLVRIFEKIFNSFYSITSIYILIVITYHLVEHSFERLTFAFDLHTAFAVILRLHFVIKGELIISEVSSLQKVLSKYVTYPEKSLKSWIIIGCILSNVTAVIGVCCLFWVTPESVDDIYKFYITDMGIPETYENYHFIFSGLIILVNNSLQFTGQDLAVMLICSVYRKLDCFISDFKRYLTASYFAGNPTPKTIHNFATKVNLLSASIIKIDRAISPLAFYLLCLFLFQTLEIATVFSKENLPFWYITFSMYLVITLVPKLILLVILGSRIHERFAEIKELVLTAPVLNDRILYETPSGINHIALCHIVESLSDKAFMTAMGVIKIEKNVILSILCAFISYSVLITQVFNK
ncbi:hypothetical protein NPIL_605401 [Nephila pilipes]|uniref:Gustatory receptor n=1 Tax=Nephila pilipes TaxID=299642 RepID=A0A8X6U9X4_NEPPI|nr:hypothetical protein NPIL_399381 [Nephila pilipes]GFT96278.1 hypothetical protein NPIL_605401 [Nephila pilipes]